MKQIKHEGYTIRIDAENVESEQHIRFHWDAIDSDDETINGGTSPTEQSAIDSGMAAIDEVVTIDKAISDYKQACSAIDAAYTEEAAEQCREYAQQKYGCVFVLADKLGIDHNEIDLTL